MDQDFEQPTAEEEVVEAAIAPEDDPAYRDPALVYLIYVGYAHEYHSLYGPVFRRGVPTGVEPAVAEKLLLLNRRNKELVKE